MRRVLEKLAHERKDKEEHFQKRLKELKEKANQIADEKSILRLNSLVLRLENLLKEKEELESEKGRGTFFPFLKKRKLESRVDTFYSQTIHVFRELQSLIEKETQRVKDISALTTDLFELNLSLMDAKDREWDALGSNHVGMIFKSMEWRVDKLQAVYEDTKALMKTFLFLKKELEYLLQTLEEKKTPSPSSIKRILYPLEDWRYAGFENRFRGSEEEVKKQQSQYLVYFIKKGKVLDLGCGRGEFLELLEENGIEAEGIDLNEQMIEICKEKGLKCQKGDILEKLSEFKDESLSGIFSSQVVEHLSSSYLKSLIELAYFKLAPSCYIVLETINPTSVFSLVEIYFLDPFHKRPIHPHALKFLLEGAGFEKVEIKYSSPLEKESLQELPQENEFTSILNQNLDKLNALLFAPTNYAAIGLKP